jgi:hypothetical protein
VTCSDERLASRSRAALLVNSGQSGGRMGDAGAASRPLLLIGSQALGRADTCDAEWEEWGRAAVLMRQGGFMESCIPLMLMRRKLLAWCASI